jgi:hypothetical protein
MGDLDGLMLQRFLDWVDTHKDVTAREMEDEE